nr:caspase family protein [uncultured Roseibium sp.]
MVFLRSTAILIFLIIPELAVAKVYALTVGIDQYAHIPLLEGAVNDSNDIAETLRTVQRAHVVQLKDLEATKVNIIAAWTELTEMAGPGDYLVFHIAGHGAVQEAIFPDAGEAFDNMYLLASFNLEGDGTKERILDNEFAFLFQMEKEATVLFIADTCFSGTLARASGFGPELRVRRLPSVLEFKDDLLQEELIALGPPPPTNSNPNLLEIYAGAAGKTIPEVNINSQHRGALSYAVARAFEGQADRSNDQMISLKEMRRFIRRKVREHANGLQHPETKSDKTLNLSFPTSAEIANTPIIPKLNFHVTETDDAIIGRNDIIEELDLAELQLTDNPTMADLSLEMGSESYSFYNSTRDLIYASTSSVDCSNLSDDECSTVLRENLANELFPVLTKEIFLRRLAARPLSEDIEVWTRDAVGQYVQGDRIGILLRTETSERVFLFALDKYGKLTALLRQPILINASEAKFVGESVAQAPFGNDHLFAVAGSGDLEGFVQFIQENNERALNEEPLTPSGHSSVSHELLAKLTQGQLSTGVLPIFTIARPE